MRVQIACLDLFSWWFPGGTIQNFIPKFIIFYLIAVDISLSRTWKSRLNPYLVSVFRIFSYTTLITPPERF